MEDYQIFTYSGKKVIIHKGENFVKNELKSRLHKMDVDFDTTKNDKKYLAKLYNKAILNNTNKIKIFDRLIKDTQNHELIDDIKSNNKMESPSLFNNDISNQKVMNRMNNNRNKNNDYNNSPNFTALLANEINKNKNKRRINVFENERNYIKDKEINFEQKMIRNNNYESGINLRNNYRRNYINLYDDDYNDNIPTKSKSPMPRKINYEEKHDINQFNNGYNNQRYNQYEYNDKYRFNNNNRMYDEPIEENNNYNERNENENAYLRRNRKIMQNNTNDNIGENFFNYNQRRENNNNDISIQVNENQKKKYRYQNKNELEKNILEEEELDNESNNKSKYNIDLIVYIILLIACAMLFYFIFKGIFHFGNAITETVKETVHFISNPRRLFRDLILGLIKSILLGLVYQYIHITLPLAIVSLLIYEYKQKREFEKLCKEIIEDIKKDLEKKKDKAMSEIELIDYYSKKYNIDKKTFSKKYFKRLKELRKTDPCLKLSESINDNGEIEILWELAH